MTTVKPQKDRVLDYSAVVSIIGEDAANQLFGVAFPMGIDLDNPGDLYMISFLVRDRESLDKTDEQDK